MIRGLRLPAAGLIVAVAIVASGHWSASKPTPVQLRSTPAASTGAWTVYHHDDAHTGYDPTLPHLTSVATGWTSPALDGTVYAEPLIFNGIVYAGTDHNTIYALDQATGSEIWHTHMFAPMTGGWTCGGFQQGILGTPVIDASGGRIYSAFLGNDGQYRLFGLNLGTGAPELASLVTTPISTFDWKIQNQRGALALHNGYVYVPFGGRAGDCGNYHGYIFGVPIGGGTIVSFQTPGVGASYWAAGGIVVDDSTGKLFEASGNGTGSSCASNPDGTPVDENDAVARFSSTLVHEDAFIPQDWKNSWCINDQDLGSATPVLISPNLLFETGKWGTGFLLNPNSLGGMDGQLFPTPKPATYAEANVCVGNHSDASFGSFAYAAPYIYIECDGHGVVALSLTTGANPSFSPCNNPCAGPDLNMGGTTSFGPPIVAGGAVWAIDNGGGGLYAWDASTGVELFHSAGFPASHFVTPAEAGGQVFAPAGAAIQEFDMTFQCNGTPLFTSYFNWFDKATPGMVGDNIHLLNTGASTSSGCITLNGQSIPFSLPPGQETYQSFPFGTIGGPVVVKVMSGPAVPASQRVQYFQSFNEVWAMSPAQAATTLYIPWFDKATPGMVGDNIHVLNPQASTANVSVTLPGQPAINFALQAGQETYVSFPFGAIGGPVVITASQAVLAAQRVQYFQSFNEEVARPATQAQTTSYFNWFDKATPGMTGDNLHILNPGASTANLTVSLPGASDIVFPLQAGQETYVTFPFGRIGGPVTVSSSQPVLASQRVQYFQSFNEVPQLSASQASTSSHVMWFDKATPGMVGDNVHVLNTSPSAANLTISLPGASDIVFTLQAGQETYVSFPFGSIGGPVTINSSQPVLAAQRVQYFQSFNEVASA